MEEMTVERLYELLRERKGTHASAFPIGVPDRLLEYLLECEAMVRCAGLLTEPELPGLSRHGRPTSFGLCSAPLPVHELPTPVGETLALHGIWVPHRGPAPDGEAS